MSNHTFIHCMAEAAILVLSVYNFFYLKTSFIEDNSGPSRALSFMCTDKHWHWRCHLYLSFGLFERG